MYSSEKYFIFGWASQILGKDGQKIWAKTGKSHFSRAFEGNMSKWPLNGWVALDCILLDKKFPFGYENLRGKFENNAF